VGLLALASLPLVAGCDSATETPPIPQKSAAEAVRSHLQNAGLDVMWLAKSQRSDFFGSGVRRATLRVGGPDGSLMHLYGFREVEQAAQAAAAVSHDGMSVPAGSGVAQVEWVGPPHFFRQGRLIALFVEGDGAQPNGSRDRLVLKVLRGIMGPQFAGAALPSE
jgi:hypothetical protein